MKISQLDKNNLDVQTINKILFSYNFVEIKEQNFDNLPCADAAIVLGNWHEAEQRMSKAISLYKAKKIPLMFLTGGVGVKMVNNPKQTTTEAKQMEAIAIREGVATQALVLEDKATNTVENLKNVNLIISKGNIGIRKMYVVTSPYHIARALKLIDIYMPNGIEYIPVLKEGELTHPSNWANSEVSFGKCQREAINICNYVELGYIADYIM